MGAIADRIEIGAVVVSVVAQWPWEGQWNVVCGAASSGSLADQ
jgi:hypothetical protein